MSVKIVIEHTVEEINAILSALAKRPFEEVHELIVKIREQGLKQLGGVSQENPEPAAEVDSNPPTGD